MASLQDAHSHFQQDFFYKLVILSVKLDLEKNAEDGRRRMQKTGGVVFALV
jgi:hypothetical protein